MKLLASLATGVCAAALLTTPSLAQTPTALSDLVVTASKREQSLTEAPLSLTYIPGALAQDAGVHDIKDLQVLVPSLLVASTSNPTYTTARIRGVGTVGDNPGLESSVGVVIDGVQRSRNGVALTDLGELERIEVLKGPQGTVFGKSTSAGVINVLTKAPAWTFGAEGELTVGEHGARGVSAAVTGPIVDDILAGRLYAASRVRDGYYAISTGEGPRTETRDDDQDLQTIRGQLLWKIAPAATLRVIGDWTRREENCCVGVTVRTGPSAPWVDSLAADNGVLAPADPGARRANWNRNTHAFIDDQGLSAELNWDSGGAALTSLTAWRLWDADLGQDWDFTSADVAYRPDDGAFGARFETISQELRLAGASERLDWMVGAYYGQEDLTRTDALYYGADYEAYLGLVLTGGANPNRVSELTGLPVGASYVNGQGERDAYDHETRTWALFTDNTLHIAPGLDLNAGLRFTADKKTVDARYSNTDGGRACAAALARSAASTGTLCLPWSNPAFNNLTLSQSLSDENTSGQVKLIGRPNERIGVYVGYARGYKAGGFNLDRAQTNLIADRSTAFPAETVRSADLGVKTNWMDGRLIVNASLFDMRFDDFQLNTFLGTTFVVRSIPRVTARGADLDFIWRAPVEGLTLQGGATYADTKYGTHPTPGLPLLPGARLAFAPLWSASLSGGYERNLGDDLKGRLSLSAKYSSDYNTGSDLLPAKVQKAFVLVNARVAVAGAADRWALELWAQNLTDERYYQVAYNAPFQGSTGLRDAPAPVYDAARDTQTYGAFLGAPRTLGATVRLRY
jgi:iron complex outermembrane recepter protein